MNATSPAIVLRRTEYGDADLIVSLLARDLGKLSALARAARKSQRRFGAALGLATVSRVELARRPGAELWTLVSAQVTRTFPSIPGDMASFAHASYATELARELSPAEAPEPAVFDLAVELFATLEHSGASPFVLRAFESRLLDEVGLRPMWDRCAGCGTDSLDQALLDPNRGGAVCRKCAAESRGMGVRPLSAAARRILSAAGEIGVLADAADRTSEHGGEGATEARDAMLSVLLHHIGKPLKTVEFIAKLSAGP